MILDSLKSLFDAVRERMIPAKPPGNYVTHGWEQFADQHTPGLERITVAAMGIGAETPVSEKEQKLKYMYLQTLQIRDKVDHVRAAEKILQAVKILNKDPKSSVRSSLFYAGGAWEIIFLDARDIQPDIAIETVETGILVFTQIAEKHKFDQAAINVTQRALVELRGLQKNLAKPLQPLKHDDNVLKIY